MKPYIFFLLGLLLLGACQGSEEDTSPSLPTIPSAVSNLFTEPIAAGVLNNLEIQEASGLAHSRSFTQALWTHNDSGDEARLFLISNQGEDLGQIALPSLQNRDWEDMALAQDPQNGQYYIYLADIGSNNNTGTLFIHRFPEPSAQATPLMDTIGEDQIETFELNYPTEVGDAETLLVDAQGNVFIISKELNESRIFKASLHNSGSPIPLEAVGSLPLSLVVGGDFLASSQEILLKTYNQVYLWQIAENAPLETALTQQSPLRLAYTREPQGEAIAWHPDGQAYFTLSEIFGGNSTTTLFVYNRQ